MKQADIMERIESLIPADILARYTHLSYGEMAELPDLADWKYELLHAESDWFECADA